MAVSDAESFLMTRKLAREEALLTGGSCGLAVVATLRVAAAAAPDDVIVVLLPDTGRGYLAKIFNDEWMTDYGFLTTETKEPRVADVLNRKLPGLPEFVHAHPEETVSAAIGLLREYNVSQLPVMKQEPPVMAAEVVGSIVESDLLDALVSAGPGPMTRSGGTCQRPCPWSARGSRSAARSARWRRRAPRWCWWTAARPASSPGRTC